uniref:Uncharacterized protein n=1 Tax=Arundo donax TaxID=35708 RepID=A0A0A8Z9I7_ARUDO
MDLYKAPAYVFPWATRFRLLLLHCSITSHEKQRPSYLQIQIEHHLVLV